MKKAFLVLFSFLVILCLATAQNDISTDTLKAAPTHKEQKAEKKALTQHFRISAVWTYADINSTVLFEGPYGLLSTQIDFERQLGLEDRKSISSIEIVKE